MPSIKEKNKSFTCYSNKELAKTRKYLKASRPSPRIGKRQFGFDRKKKVKKKFKGVIKDVEIPVSQGLPLSSIFFFSPSSLFSSGEVCLLNFPFTSTLGSSDLRKRTSSENS
ncbi:hypothetical protein TWF102_003250 [Orbilia oligospora]|uniref:Uncharacterized protein n=1 Tax=Orbilia oligospora TaxID=2813651 RepID=A0A7C8J9R3_ORBOL|nr:hypothetical protein TWF102_003250 [Orbilia oligospora]KAF3094584.1 hypothetical protein TWF706_008423 [Orbilia oligospora]KAF3096517.1 hypothetical protein TWF103_009847 [Orbilia oligospora]KAF3136025.1 hypothetical protein TWF594_008000 [Orbilia oligospora]